MAGMVTWFGTIAVLFATLASQSPPSGKGHLPIFTPPDVVSAGDIPYPLNSVANGLVELIASLDSSGRVQRVQVHRDIPSLTAPALAAVDNWKFSPAALDDAPQSSEFSLNILFNPRNFFGPPEVPLQSPEPLRPPGTASHFVPPEVASTSYAEYPINSIAMGTVVLDVAVSASGLPQKIMVIQSVGSLTTPAVAAVKKWRFKPGTLDGVPTLSKTVVAFVFRPPPIKP